MYVGEDPDTNPDLGANQRYKVSRMTLNWLSTSTVIYSYRPPAGTDDSKGIIYTSKYHKHGDSDWTTLGETDQRYQTVKDLDQDTIYEFIVDAKDEHGQEVTPALQPLLVRTDTGQTAPRLYVFVIQANIKNFFSGSFSYLLLSLHSTWLEIAQIPTNDLVLHFPAL